MLDGDEEAFLDDVLQSRCPEQSREVAFGCARKLRLVLDGGIELVHGVPVHAQRALAAAVIPDARRHDASLARHTRHLPQSRHGV